MNMPVARLRRSRRVRPAHCSPDEKGASSKSQLPLELVGEKKISLLQTKPHRFNDWVYSSQQAVSTLPNWRCRRS